MSKFEPFAIIVNPDELSFCAAASMLIADAWSNPDAAIYLAFKRDGITQISRSTLLERIYGYTDIGVRRIYLVGYCMDTKKYLYHKATTTDLVFINSNYLFEHVSSSIQAKYRKFF